MVIDCMEVVVMIFVLLNVFDSVRMNACESTKVNIYYYLL